MSLAATWSMAQVAHSFTALAAVGVSWSIWRRAPRGRDTWLLLGSLLLLALHYGAMAMDAWLHATGATDTRFTVWSGLGQTLSTLSCTCLILFLLAVVERVLAPERPSRALATMVIAQTGLSSAVALLLCAWVVWDLAAGARPAIIEADVTRIMRDSASVPTVLFVAGPGLLLNVLFERVPTTRHTWLMPWIPGDARMQSSASDARMAHPFMEVGLPLTTQDFRALSGIYATALLLIGIRMVNYEHDWTPLSVGISATCRDLLLVSVLSLVYYHARFVFFDVVLKRGVLFVAVASVATIMGFGASRAIGLVNADPQVAWLCVGATLFIYTSACVFERGNRWLDRVIFHRPNYRTELSSLLDAMARCPDTAALSATVTTRLTTTLGASFVRFGPEVTSESHLAVGLGRPERPRGYLSLGPRTRGQHYGSEDVSFLEAVAAQFAGLVEAFEAREAKYLATAAELRALRAQINPHFLFNALTTLAEMARAQPATERAILNLSRIFRYALESTRHELVPLGAEVAAIRSYLEIETERFDDQVRFAIDVPRDLLEAPVPPMLLQPLVENAVKHGVAGKVGGGTIRISAARRNGHLRMTVADDGVGFDAAQTPPNVGLANVRARVEQTGGSCHVHSTPGAGTSITIEVVTP